jgi:hypothetical protein
MISFQPASSITAPPASPNIRNEYLGELFLLKMRILGGGVRRVVENETLAENIQLAIRS